MSALVTTVRPSHVTRRARQLVTIWSAAACLLLLAACGGTPPVADVDLHVHDVTAKARLAEGDWWIEARFQFTNHGSQNSPLVDIEFSILDDGDVVATFSYPEFSFRPAGVTSPVYFGRKLADTFVPGDYTVRLVLDPDHRVPQSDRTNDIVEVPLTIE